MTDTDTKIDEILDTLLNVECQEFHRERISYEKGLKDAKNS